MRRRRFQPHLQALGAQRTAPQHAPLLTWRLNPPPAPAAALRLFAGGVLSRLRCDSGALRRRSARGSLSRACWGPVGSAAWPGRGPPAPGAAPRSWAPWRRVSPSSSAGSTPRLRCAACRPTKPWGARKLRRERQGRHVRAERSLQTALTEIIAWEQPQSSREQRGSPSERGSAAAASVACAAQRRCGPPPPHDGRQPRSFSWSCRRARRCAALAARAARLVCAAPREGLTT